MLIHRVIAFINVTPQKYLLLFLCAFFVQESFATFPLHPGSIGSDQTVCIGSIPNPLTSITPATNGIGTYNYQWQISTTSSSTGFSNIIGANSLTYSPGAVSVVTYFRRVVSTLDDPAVATDAITIDVLPLSVGGTIIGPGGFCAGKNSTLYTLTNHVGTVLEWQYSTSSNFSSNIVSIPNTDSLTSYTVVNSTVNIFLRVKVQNGNCPPVFSEIKPHAVVVPIPVAGSISGPTSACQNSNNITTLTLVGSVGSVVKWQSSNSLNFNTSITDINNTTTTLNLSNLNTALYYRAIVSNGPIFCLDTSEPKPIFIDQSPVAGTLTGSDSICLSVIPNNNVLRLSTYFGNILKWQSSLNANFSSTITDINITTDTLLVNNISQTTYYRVILSNGNCNNDTSNIVHIFVNAASNGGNLTGNNPFSPNVNLCAGINSTTLVLNSYTGSIIKWQSSVDSNFNFSVIDIFNTNNSLIINNLLTTTYYRVIVQNADCDTAYSNTRVVNVFQPSYAGQITNDTICFNSGTILRVKNYIGNILQWQSSSSSNFTTHLQTFANNSDSLVVNNLINTTYFRVIVKNGICSVDTSLIAFIKVDTNAFAGTLSKSDTICINQNSITLKLTISFGSVAFWQSSTTSDFSTNLQTINNTSDSLVLINLTTSTYYRVIVVSGVCSSDTSQSVFIKVDTFANAGLLSGSDTICSSINNTNLFVLNTFIGSVVKWQSATDSNFTLSLTDIANNTDSLRINNITQTTYYRVILSNGVCGNDTSNAAYFFINAPSNAGVLSGNNPFNPNIIVCADSNSSTLILSAYVGSIIKWQSAADSNFTFNLTDINNTVGSLLVTNLSTTTYYRVIVQNADCEPDTSNLKVIIVNQTSVAGQILSDTICINGSTILRLKNYLGSILEWQSSSSSDFSTNLQTIVNTNDSLVINNLLATTYYRVIVKNGVCTVDTSLVAFVKVVSNSYSNTIISPQPDTFIISGNPNTIIGSINTIDSNFISYQWQYALTTDSTLFINISNSDSVNHDPNTITQTTWYRRIIYNSICNSYDTSNVIRLTVTDIDTNINIKARLGLALNVANPINLSEGIYQIDYRITIKNYGNTGLEKIKLKENLSDVFPAPSAFAILNIQSSTGLILDPNFDGVNQLYLLDSNQNVINVGSSHTIDIRIQVQTNLSNVIYYNQVTALANAVNISIAAVDTSVDGLNPDPNNDSIPDEESPTIVEITVFVPSGFSPNGDGKNDEFKIKGIENYPNNKLEIYNRWGNKVFEQAPYDNTWRGDVKNTDAYIIGDGLLPSGTYFYLLDFGVPGMKQLSGYIVIRK